MQCDVHIVHSSLAREHDSPLVWRRKGNPSMVCAASTLPRVKYARQACILLLGGWRMGLLSVCLEPGALTCHVR